MSGLTFQSGENEKHVGNIQWNLEIVSWVLSPIYFTKGGFKSEGRGGFSQLPKMSAEKTYLGFRK